MSNFTFRAWGFIFWIVDIVSAVLLFILCLIPSEICARVETDSGIGLPAKTCYDVKPLAEGVMGVPLCAAIFALIFNIVRVAFLNRVLCHWSALEFANETEAQERGDTTVMTQWRLVMPRFGITIELCVLHFLAFIVAAAKIGMFKVRWGFTLG